MFFAKDLKEYNGVTLQYVGIMPKNIELDKYVKEINGSNIKSLIDKLKTIELKNFNFGKITEIKGHIPLFKFDYELEFKVNRYDTDMNKHVNNIKYLQWVLESVPEDIINNYYLHSIDGRFIAEANYGQTILSLTKNDIENESFIHTIKTKGDDKVCARAKTIWRKL